MNTFDSTILHFLNQFSCRFAVFDKLAVATTQFYLLRGLPMILPLWWFWFRDGPTTQRDREIVVATIVASLCALVVGRLLGHWLPFRVRPFANPELGLQFLASGEDEFRTWSAFPSDHAMMWCAMATGVLLVSRRIGIFVLAYAFLVIGMGRVYVGLHHPTDVLAGAVLGVAICLLLNRERVRQLIAAPVLHFSSRHQPLFHVGMFLLSFELVTQFDELRQVGSYLIKFYAGA